MSVKFVNLIQCRSVSTLTEKEEDLFWYSDQWLMEPVFFGIRYQCLISKGVRFLGQKEEYKETNKLNLIESISEYFRVNLFPDDTLFEGYLTFDGNKKDAYSFLKSFVVEESLKKKAIFYITDILYYNGTDIFNMPLFDRKNLLKKIVNESENVRLQQGYSKNKKQVFEQLKDRFKVFLFKDYCARYSFKQSVACRIYKVSVSYYMIVMGAVSNEDEKYKGMVVALEGGQYKNGILEKIMNVPVHNNDSRIKLYDRRKEIEGKIFEIHALEKTNENKYQDARFVCMRNNKTSSDCIF